MRINFTKMQALGNDFVVIDGVRQKVRLSAEQARRIADRHYGIGCDQILLAEPAVGEGADFFYRIFNADGGEVQQCGNGARCFARFVHERGLTEKPNIVVDTLGGPMLLRLCADTREVAVEMGVPRFEPQQIPFDAATEAPTYTLDIGGQPVELSVLAIGNPHAVQRVADVDSAPVAAQGPLIERHRCFPERVNAGFMQVVDRNHLRLRVYERGAGETLACGSGACAAVVAGRRLDLLDKNVTVDLRGGRLSVAWPGPGAQVVLAGPAESVFDGEIELH